LQTSRVHSRISALRHHKEVWGRGQVIATKRMNRISSSSRRKPETFVLEAKFSLRFAGIHKVLYLRTANISDFHHQKPDLVRAFSFGETWNFRKSDIVSLWNWTPVSWMNFGINPREQQNSHEDARAQRWGHSLNLCIGWLSLVPLWGVYYFSLLFRSTQIRFRLQ
jgi:hypothetical protein